MAVEVNKLVTTFEFKIGSGIKQYEATLRKLDQQGAKSAARFGAQLDQRMAEASRSIDRRFNGLFKAIERRGESMKFNAKVNVDTSVAKARIKEVESAAGGLMKKFGGLALGFGGGALSMSGAMQMGNYIKDAAGEFETSMTRLTTLVGKQRAGGVFKGLQTFANTTPFELKDVMDFFITTQGAGFDFMNRQTGALDYKAITKAGDLAAASNRGLPELAQAMLSSARGLPNMMDNFIGMAGKAVQEDGESFIQATMMDPRSGKQLADKRIDPRNKKDLLDFWLQGGSREGVAGGMKELSKTLPGQISTMSDAFKSLAQDFWNGGLGEIVHSKIMDKLITDLGDKGLSGKMKELGKAAGVFVEGGIKAAPGIIKEIARWAPLAATGLGLMAANAVGLKVMGAFAAGGGMMRLLGGLGRMNALTNIGGLLTLIKSAGPLRFLGMSLSVLGSGLAAALTPVLIGGAAIAAIAGIGALGFKVFEYWTKGDKALEGIRQKYPILADAIKNLGDATKAWWPEIQKVGDAFNKSVGPAAKWALEKVIVPGVSWAIDRMADFFKGIKIIYDVAMPLFQKAWEGFFDWITPKFEWLLDKLPKIRDGMDTTGAYSLGKGGVIPGGNPTGGGLTGNFLTAGSAGLGLASMQGQLADYDPVLGNRFATIAKGNAPGTYGWCATRVNQDLEKIGVNSAGDAWTVADQMLASGRFKEIKGLRPEDLPKLPAGFTVVWGRAPTAEGRAKAGPGHWGWKAGHVSVADGYGNEISDHIDKQMTRHYAGGGYRVLMPVKKPQQVTMKANGGGGQMGGEASASMGPPSMQVNQTIYVQDSSKYQVKQLAAQGVVEAFTSMSSEYPQAVRPG